MNKILIIESNYKNRNFLLSLLETAPFHILVADNGWTGLRLAVQEQPDFIILNLELLVINGFRVLEQLHDFYNNENLKIIMIKGKNSLIDIERAKKLGVNNFINKEDISLNSTEKILEEFLCSKIKISNNPF